MVMASFPVAVSLDDDVLLMIIDIITNPMPARDTQHRPSNLVRAASQVCRRWRGLLISSPWIWGRVIDLGKARYGLGRKAWIEEVTKRAGSAPLWISGNVMKASAGSLFDGESCFIGLLDMWERIEKLVVDIQGERISIPIQRCFLSRAPILKLFDVYFAGISYNVALQDTLCQTAGSSGRFLFGNYAPSLVKMNSDQVAFKVDSAWLSNIREIVLSTQTFNISEVLALLQNTSLLESLVLTTPSDLWDSTPHIPMIPRIDLPHLSCIHIQSTSALTAAIMGNVTPGILSILRIELETLDIPSRDILSTFTNTMPLYISRRLTASTSRTILFELSNSIFRLCDNTAAFPSAQGHINFDIQFSRSLDSSGSHRSGLLSYLLDSFRLSSGFDRNPSLFESVTELRLKIEDTRSSGSFASKLYAMLSIFQQVHDIETDKSSMDTLWYLSSKKNQTYVLFPKLRTLRLTTLYVDGSRRFRSLTHFLIHRKTIGYPVARLDLTSCRSRSDRLHNFSSLEPVEGLEVVWREQSECKEDVTLSSYVCGTGEPERLTLELC